MKALVLSCSLHAESRSRIMAGRAAEVLSRDGVEADFADLAQLPPLPLCDGGPSHRHPDVLAIQARIAAAQAVILAVPIYNYDANAAAKNLIELTGPAWEEKVVGFLCAAGGTSSYMSVMALANSLMLDFRCLIVPRFVYATGSSFAGKELSDPAVGERIASLARETARLAKTYLGSS